NDISESISNEESLRRLREFLRQVESMLADLVEHPRPVIPGRYHESMNAAWSAVRVNFKTATDALQMPRASNIRPKLEQFGLTGPQLVFKLSIFQHARDELMDYGTAKDGQQRKRRWWKRWLGLFKPALKVADVILGSLVAVLPVLEAIKEY